MRSAFWDYAALLTGRATSIALLAAVMVLITRLLGPAGYGKFAIYLTIGQLFFLLAVSWSASGVVRYGREEFIKTGGIARTFWARNCFLILFLALSTIVIYGLWGRLLDGLGLSTWLAHALPWDNEGILDFLRPGGITRYIGIDELTAVLLVVTVVTLAAEDYTSRVLQSTNHIQFFGFSATIAHTVTVGLLVVVLVVRPSQVTFFVILSYIAGRWAATVVGFWRTGLPRFLPVRIDPAYVRLIWLFSYPLILGSACTYLISWAPLMVVKGYLSEAEVGNYGVAQQGLNVLRQIPLTLTALAVPMVLTFRVEGHDSFSRRFIETVIPGAAFLWSLGLVPVAFAARYVIPLLFSHQYVDAILPFKVLCISLAFSGFNALYAAIYLNYDIVRQSTVVSVILAVLNIFGAILLVGRFGLSGVAWAGSAAFALSAFLNLFICQRRMGVRHFWHVLLAFPVVAYVLVAVFMRSAVADAAGFILVMLGSVLVARAFRLFKARDLELFQEVHMPAPARRLLLWAYRLLGAGTLGDEPKNETLT